MVGRNIKKGIFTKKYFLLFSVLILFFSIHVYVSSKQLNDNHRLCWPVLGKEKEVGENKPKPNEKPQTW